MTLSVSQLTIQDQHGLLHLGPFNFDIEAGQILTLMGASGSGKSTLLNAIAGHLPPSFRYDGQILLQQQCLNTVPPHLRRIAILFQDDLLFPHLNVWQNLAFAIPQSVTGKARKERALQVLKQLDLVELQNSYSPQISGGQRARISMMRLLLSQPKAILLDEPFSKLDKNLRHDFRQFVFEQIKLRQIPALMVTHDDADIPVNGSVITLDSKPQQGNLC